MVLQIPAQTATCPSTCVAQLDTHSHTECPGSHRVSRIHDAASAVRLLMECFLNAIPKALIAVPTLQSLVGDC